MSIWEVCDDRGIVCVLERETDRERARELESYVSADIAGCVGTMSAPGCTGAWQGLGWCWQSWE